MEKPCIDNTFTRPAKPKARCVSWEYYDTFLYRLEQTGYVVTKVIEGDLGIYVEYVWVTK